MVLYTNTIAIYQRAFLIYNPRAGALRRAGEQLLRRTEMMLKEAGHSVTPLPTTGPETAGPMARDCVNQRGADLILAFGGDGTINEVANGMIGTDIPLGILPGGTANVLAMELGIGRDVVEAARRLNECVSERIAVGQLEIEGRRRYFLLMAGIGLDAHIVYHIDAGLKAKFGKVAYWLSGFRMVTRLLPEFQAHLRNGATATSFALASRVGNYGGDLTIAPSAHLMDNDFEMVLFRGRHAAVYLKYLLGVLTGRLAKISGVTVERAATARFEQPADSRVYVQIDGEYAGRLPATVSIAPETLLLLLPPAYQRRGRRG